MDIPIVSELSESLNVSGFQERLVPTNHLVNTDGLRRRNLILNTVILFN